MSGRPLKIPGHRPLSRPEDREQPFSGGKKRDPRLGPVPRCLSRARRPGAPTPPTSVVTEKVAARESLARRLRRVADTYAEGRTAPTEVRRELVDNLLNLRIVSLEVVEAVERWRSATGRDNAVWIDAASGENYLLKMKADTQWLADSPLGDFLSFSPKSDPFFVVPSTRECLATPSNSMTPTLQARRQHCDRSKAVLPLQASLLRRIRAAELVIMRDSVHAKMQGKTSASIVALKAAVVGDDGSTASTPRGKHTCDLAPSAYTASGIKSVQRPQSAPFNSTLQGEAIVAARSDVAEPEQFSKSLWTTAPLMQKRPTPPAEPEFAFRLEPISATKDSIEDIFMEYNQSCDTRLAATMEPWSILIEAIKEDGPCALEWFWLVKSERSGLNGKPDGLAVFRLKKMCAAYGQLLHISVVDRTLLGEAIDIVKWHMFGWLPIRNIRVTLWYTAGENGDLTLDKEAEGIFKKKYFRWFQLTNARGVRGQVMNRPRGEPPDDPEQPTDLSCIQVCLGQVWLRCLAGATRGGRSSMQCAHGLLLAAACLRYLWTKDAAKEAASQAADQGRVAMVETVRQGLIRGLLSGEMEKLLSRRSPVTLAPEEVTFGGAQHGPSPSELVMRTARSLEASGNTVPGVVCEGSEDAADLIHRGITASGYAEAAAGLGVEDLPQQVTGIGARDAAFGRLFITLDIDATPVPDNPGCFEVCVHASGSCPTHPHPIFYIPTSEDDTFAVVIPWGEKTPIPSHEDVFSCCTHILRNTEPTDPARFTAVRMDEFGMQQPVRIHDVADSRELGAKQGTTLHVAEFGAISVMAGRNMPGRLRSAADGGSVFSVRRPFLFALWHTDLDSLNVPLVAVLVS